MSAHSAKRTQVDSCVHAADAETYGSEFYDEQILSLSSQSHMSFVIILLTSQRADAQNPGPPAGQLGNAPSVRIPAPQLLSWLLACCQLPRSPAAQ